RGLKGDIADRPDVAASKTREEVDVGGPRADTGDRDEPRRRFFVMMLRERIDRQPAVAHGARERLEGARLGARKTKLHQSLIAPSQNRRRIKGMQLALKTAPDRIRGFERQHLLGDDAQKTGKALGGAPQGRWAEAPDDIGKARLAAGEIG